MVNRICIFLLLLILPVIIFAEDYFVSSSGSNSNPGTEQKPWKTLETVNSRMSAFKPGDRILFRRGDVFSGELRISKSGSAQNPLIFGSYGDGDLPVIRGTKLISGWTPESGKI